jgi:pimeloyl-ACP methyl ester carboxylesterase
MAGHPEPRLHQRLRLLDGRTIGFAEYGDPAGKPILFFPGAPSGRLFHHPDESIAREVGARLITLDRPGYGLSDFQPRRTLLSWPSDVQEIAIQLGLARFAVAGLSAGGPYAAACAFKIPRYLTHVAIISGVGPADVPEDAAGMPATRRVGMAVGRWAPWLLRPLMWLANNPSRGPEKHWRRVWRDSARSDRAILERPAVKTMLMTNWAEATRPGIRGFVHDSLTLTRSWGFRLEDIAREVHLWHGEEDASIPVDMGRRMARGILRSRPVFLPGEGHFLFFDHWREILDVLVS